MRNHSGVRQERSATTCVQLLVANKAGKQQQPPRGVADQEELAQVGGAPTWKSWRRLSRDASTDSLSRSVALASGFKLAWRLLGDPACTASKGALASLKNSRA